MLPSFTFSATAHAVAWNGRETRFVECRRRHLPGRPAAVADALDGADTILATHVFGAPCEADALATIARDAGASLVFDAAHGMGAVHGEVPIGGWGDAEVFSLSPTKPLVAGEGGIVTTTRRRPGRTAAHRARLRQPRRLRHALRRVERAHVRAARRVRPSRRSTVSTRTSRTAASSPARTLPASRLSRASVCRPCRPRTSRRTRT